MSAWDEIKRACSKVTPANFMRMFWPLPSFGWDTLAFSDRLKLVAFFIAAGAGMSMTLFATYAMYALTLFHAVWPVFYMGAAAMLIIAVVITGLMGLLIKRSVKAEVGMFKFESQDAETAKEMMNQLPTTSTKTITTPEGQPDVTTTTVTPSDNSSA